MSSWFSKTSVSLSGSEPFKWITLNVNSDSLTINLCYNNDILVSEYITMNSAPKQIKASGGGNGKVCGELWANSDACFFSGKMVIENVATLEFKQEVVTVIYS